MDRSLPSMQQTGHSTQTFRHIQHGAIDIGACLRTSAIFAGLPRPRLRDLAGRFRVLSFQRGETIFHQGEAGETLYLIACGQVRIYHPSAIRRETVVAFFRAGDCFGELALLDDQPRSASAAAMHSTTTLTLDRVAFLALLRDDPAIASAIQATLAARLRASTAAAAHLTTPSPLRRLGLILLDLARRYGLPNANGTRIDLRLTQDDLADLSGTTRETVNRVLGSLRDQGLMATERGQILICDCCRLAQAVEGAP